MFIAPKALCPGAPASFVLAARGASKDRHENIGLGYIGFDALNYIAHHEAFKKIPKILETPYVALSEEKEAKTVPPYKYEIEMLKSQKNDVELLNKIRQQ